MDKRFIAALIFAFIMAIGSSFLPSWVVSNTQPILAPKVKLVLASRDLEPGTVIRESDLVLTDSPGGEVPTVAFSHAQDVVGRGVITKIYAREPILETRLTPRAPTCRQSRRLNR